MKRLLCLVMLSLISVAFGQDLPILYEPRAEHSLTDTTPANLLSQVSSTAARAQREACGGKPIGSGGRGDFATKLEGSFTTVKATQTVYVISGCILDGISVFYVALFQAQQLINLYRLTVPGFLAEAYGVNDVNLNGLRELALIYAWQDGCDGVCTFRTLNLLEFTQNSLESRASLLVERGGDAVASSRYTYTVYVLKGAKPNFIGLRSTGTTTLTALGNTTNLVEILKVK